MISSASSSKGAPQYPIPDLLQPLRNWINTYSIQHPHHARRLAHLIPAQCPFEQDIMVWGYRVAHVPPLCKLNPLYDELMGLRFRALCYLADECGEDISALI
ncbi:Mo-dependent nitrogenase C-terminal domain-containing protein [Leptolyngbya sp. PCC 6406]|uniref:Mo-dependent nitrogenase C-terminal domain-containing protein n=1 Tax=Leptolyngbya sp. PCC 6406 TaxID=1173264 RepID=UPI0002AC9883|nr:Mo-dependent nitrogenase C-terminal domain-containing protein [Leptolyngbya sp. PCC 6406]